MSDALGENRIMRSIKRTDEQIVHGDAVVKAFFLPDKRERFLAFVTNPKKSSLKNWRTLAGSTRGLRLLFPGRWTPL